MRLLRLFALALGLCAACGTTPGLDLAVTPTTIGGDGASPITVLAKLTQGGAPVDSGTVHLTVDVGRFKDASSDPKAIDTTDGSATIIPPRIGHGAITVTATASVDGTALKKTATVALTPAGGLASSLTFTCAKQNIGALVTGRSDPIHVLCTAKAFDATNKEIPNASIETMAEAGTLAWQTDDASGTQYLVYTVNPGDTPPKDVDPLGPDGKPRSQCPPACIADPTKCDAEPCWIDTGKTRNPRDGLATLVAAVPAAPGFNTQGEPFVDADDSGAREAGETYIDYNGNGKYDPPDGTKQNTLMVWQALRIVWSGDLDASKTAHGSGFTSSVNGKSATVTLRLSDANYNTLAASGAAGTDLINLTAGTCDNGGNLTMPASLPMEQTKAGIKLNPQTGGIDGPGFPTSYLYGGDYTFTATIDATGNTCPIDATLTRAYDPGAPPLFSSSGSASGEAVPTGSLKF